MSRIGKLPVAIPSGVTVQAKYGPSGTLRDAIAGGEPAHVFASANMEHPQSLARAGKSGAVALFAGALWLGQTLSASQLRGVGLVVVASAGVMGTRR